MMDVGDAKDESDQLGHNATSSEAQLQYAPINNTRLRRFLVLCTVKLLERFRPRQGSVLFISNKTCIKYSRFQDLSEAYAMQYIARNTSIPVPRVHCAFKNKGWTYIVMDRLPGEMLVRNWSARTDESKAMIFSQLKTMVEEMRSLPATRGSIIANANGGPLFDGRVPGTSMRFGPFKNTSDFHKHLRRGIEAHPDHFTDISELIAWHEGPWPLPVFTHGDLSSLNILADGDKITGIIDWETAGWYPTYWEYATACQVNPRNYFWREEIDKFIDSSPEWAKMEQIRLKYFGDV